MIRQKDTMWVETLVQHNNIWEAGVPNDPIQIR